MGTARPKGRRLSPLPRRHTTIQLDRYFSPEEMKRIQRGFEPHVMEDKWFIYWKDDTLYFHRSWTGNCIYVVRFVREGEGWRMVEAKVNRDPNQYTETNDETDVGLISFLIDLLLLRRPDTRYPAEGLNSATGALWLWSFAGRAILGQYPDDENDDGSDD